MGEADVRSSRTGPPGVMTAGHQKQSTTNLAQENPREQDGWIPYKQNFYKTLLESEAAYYRSSMVFSASLLPR